MQEEAGGTLCPAPRRPMRVKAAAYTAPSRGLSNGLCKLCILQTFIQKSFLISCYVINTNYGDTMVCSAPNNLKLYHKLTQNSKNRPLPSDKSKLETHRESVALQKNYETVDGNIQMNLTRRRPGRIFKESFTV